MSEQPTTNNPSVIGIDVGGTTIELGKFRQDGTCDASLSIHTPQPAYPQAVVDAIAKAIAQIDPNSHSIAIGIGTPGPADAEGRMARYAINLAEWNDVPLADLLEAETQLPVVVANDANCAGLGEAWLGAGRHLRNLIVLTLGTGVGGAIILDGKLFVGHQGTAGELGLITINLYGPECKSGNQGSLEQHVCTAAIQRETGMKPETLARLAAKGNSQAIAFWQHYGHMLGAGVANLIYVLAPEAVILGGGICNSAEFFLPSVESEIERRVVPPSREGLQILIAKLGNHAGMVGAAKLAWQLVANSSSQIG